MQVKASEVPGDEVPGPRGQKWVVHFAAPTVPHTHGAPFEKQLIIYCQA